MLHTAPRLRRTDSSLLGRSNEFFPSLGRPLRLRSRREVPQMNSQSDHAGHGGLLNNFWAQVALVAIVAVIVIALAAQYIW
jgi:hypothetical protein